MASNTIRQLAQGNLTTAFAQYVTGTASNTIVKEATIINHGSSTETVELHIKSTTPTDNTSLVYKITLAAGESAGFNGSMVVNSGSFIYAKTTNNTSVAVSFHGMDMA
jgi:hypothetical protein